MTGRAQVTDVAPRERVQGVLRGEAHRVARELDVLVGGDDGGQNGED